MKTILYENVTDEQQQKFDELLVKIIGLHPNELNGDVSMFYDAWTELYTIDFGGTLIESQIIHDMVYFRYFNLFTGDMYFKQCKGSMKYYRIYNKIFDYIRTFGTCVNPLKHISEIKKGDIVNTLKIIDITDEKVYYIDPKDEKTELYWSISNPSDCFDARGWGIILVKPTELDSVIHADRDLRKLI